jgi:AcrR family transcriptional regulator
MKYDLTKPLTRGAQRTLADFAQTMLTVAGEEDFDRISVNELCQRANYPRATFYNYFDDKYDLLNYCWTRISQEFHILPAAPQATSTDLVCYFDRLFTAFRKEMPAFNRIMQVNSLDGTLVSSFISFFRRKLRTLVGRCVVLNHQNLPPELMTDHIANSILLLVEWVFLKNHPVTQDQLHTYLFELLGGLQMANELAETNIS